MSLQEVRGLSKKLEEKKQKFSKRGKGDESDEEESKVALLEEAVF